MSKTTNTITLFSGTILDMADAIIENIELSSKKKTVGALTSDIYTLTCAIDITNAKMRSKDKISSYVTAIKQTCEMIQGAEQGDCVTYTYIYE